MKYTLLIPSGPFEGLKGDREFCLFHNISNLSQKILFYAKRYPPLCLDTKITEIIEYFLEYEELRLAPVVCPEERPRGVIERKHFFEQVVIGKFGYGIHLNSKKTASDLMQRDFFQIEGEVSLEECALRFSQGIDTAPEKDIIVTLEERYYGILHIKDLLYWLSQRTIQLAKDQNPLTGLPGNWAIRQEVERRLKDNEAFEVIYIDLNDFKPFNDHFGFLKGDEAIVLLGNLLKELVCQFNRDSERVFVGHIGGDDFVVIVSLGEAERFCRTLIQLFEDRKRELFPKEVWEKGYYVSVDRQGQKKRFPLLTLACAIVPSFRFETFGELSSISTEVKEMAKKISKSAEKSAYFRDRRGGHADNSKVL